MVKHKHISTSEAYQRLREAGLGGPDILPALAWACDNGKTIATGYQSLRTADCAAQASERTIVSTRVWRAIGRHGRVPAIDELEIIANFDRGTIGFSLEQHKVEEVWRSILFDLASFEIWLGDLAKRHVRALRDDEIKRWISKCGIENGGIALKALEAEYGTRVGTRESFRKVWRKVKEQRSRGRPKMAKSAKRESQSQKTAI